MNTFFFIIFIKEIKRLDCYGVCVCSYKTPREWQKTGEPLSCVTFHSCFANFHMLYNYTKHRKSTYFVILLTDVWATCGQTQEAQAPVCIFHTLDPRALLFLLCMLNEMSVCVSHGHGLFFCFDTTILFTCNPGQNASNDWNTGIVI